MLPRPRRGAAAAAAAAATALLPRPRHCGHGIAAAAAAAALLPRPWHAQLCCEGGVRDSRAQPENNKSHINESRTRPSIGIERHPNHVNAFHNARKFTLRVCVSALGNDAARALPLDVLLKKLEQ